MDTKRPRTREPAQTRLLTTALDTAANAVFITDRGGRIEYVNPAFCRLTGFSGEEALGRTPRILKSGRQDPDFYARFWKQILSGSPWSGRVVNRRRDGGLFTVIQTVTPIADEVGRVTHFVAIHEDITERVAAEQRVEHLASHDFLTDLPNRYALHARLEREAERVGRRGGRLAVLMLDLDHFKSVNDNFGHAVGDELLIAVAERLRRAVRAADILARVGGDEFAVLQTDMAASADPAQLAQRLIASVADAVDLDEQRVYTSASVGIAISEEGSAAPAELLRQSDLALYRAKQEGRNRFCFFDKAMNDEIQRQMALGHELHAALERGELFLEYQPQVDLRSRRLVGLEALARWRHPERGLIGPSEFIPLAERNGLILPIGEWVLRTACAQAVSWQRDGLPAVPVAVNLSAVQFKSPELVETIVAVLEETGLEPGLLELELTETMLMHSSADLDEMLERLRRHGVRISLDDFGRAYSSLEYLRRFPLDKLKIDQAFVKDVEVNARDATILSAVISLANKLGLEVIAEGVNDNRLDFLVDEGCLEAQGFFFAEPLSPDDVARILERGSNQIQPPGPRRDRA